MNTEPARPGAGPSVVLRVERADDPDEAATVHALHLAAFVPCVVEARLLDELRADGDLVAPLCLVAEVDGEVAGHVAISRGRVDEVPRLALGPLGVLPRLQRATPRRDLPARALTP